MYSLYEVVQSSHLQRTLNQVCHENTFSLQIALLSYIGFNMRTISVSDFRNRCQNFTLKCFSSNVICSLDEIERLLLPDWHCLEKPSTTHLRLPHHIPLPIDYIVEYHFQFYTFVKYIGNYWTNCSDTSRILKTRLTSFFYRRCDHER